MGFIRLLLVFLVGYFVISLVKRIFLPKTNHRPGQDNTRQKQKAKYKNIEDADYEELE